MLSSLLIESDGGQHTDDVATVLGKKEGAGYLVWTPEGKFLYCNNSMRFSVSAIVRKHHGKLVSRSDEPWLCFHIPANQHLGEFQSDLRVSGKTQTVFKAVPSHESKRLT